MARDVVRHVSKPVSGRRGQDGGAQGWKQPVKHSPVLRSIDLTPIVLLELRDSEAML